MNAKLAVSLVLLLIVLVFIVQNTAVTELRFLFWTLSMSRSLMMFLLLGIGLAAGWLLHAHFTSRKRR
ncbi:MAG: LapA family protein [Gammaproteobacteria bacterium]|nr:LapA family protein [Gammaproteobacteria bacterium]